MSTGPLPPLPDNRVVFGCGQIAVDFLAAVAAFPAPDEKIRSTSSKVQGGGNSGNALTCAARLGLKPRLISKVADDSQGEGILKELEADGVDTSFMVPRATANHPAVSLDPQPGPVNYICGDCGQENTLRPVDVIRCSECRYRILYKKRTCRIVQYEAR